LDKTILHPQGGGQPDDEGSLQNQDGSVKFKINSLKIQGDAILHIGNFEPEDKQFEVDSLVDCNVDETKRRLYARYHSAGHLLDIAMNRTGRTDLKPSKGFHFSSGAYVEYIGNIEAKDRESAVAELTKHCNDIISETPEE